MDSTPERLGPYEIRGTVGVGGMGVVYLGWDARLNRQVAIKTLLPALARDEKARERFLREARSAASISHPNVTQIHDIGAHEGQVFFAMEYLEGVSLEEIVEKGGPLPAETALLFVRQAAAGLKAAADRGIVHRDVKPSNLFVTRDDTLKITDFGLAKQFISDNSVTADGQFLGTPNYISPEQATGAKLDARSDIYSLGVTLYEMLSGRPPFTAESPVTVVMQHIREPVPSLRETAPRVPPPVASLVQKMLSKSPGARHQSYRDLIEHIDRVSEFLAAKGVTVAMPLAGTESVSGGRSTSLPRTRFAGRLLSYAALLLLMLGGVGFMIKQRDRLSEQPAVSVHEPLATTPVDTDTRIRRAVDGRGDRIAGVNPVQEQERPDLRIVGTSQEITEDGLLRVHGDVSNPGPGQARSITLQVVLTDAAGATLETLEVPVIPPALEAGEAGSFEAYFPAQEGQVNVMLELNWLS